MDYLYKILLALRMGEVDQLRDLLQETDPGDVRLRRKDLVEIRNLAFEEDDSDMLHSLLSKFDTSTNKDALLIRALRSDKIDIIKMLSRDKDLDVNALKSARLGRSSALMFARSLEALEFLLTEGGADLKKVDRSPGQQFLQEAVRSKSCEFIEAMIKNGANVNIGAERGEETPLILATKLGRIRVMAVLIDNGADMHYVTTDRRTALTCASKLGIQLLFQKGLNPQTVATSLGLLHAELYLTCCESSREDISKEWPAMMDIHEKDGNGQTLLIKAARCRKLSWLNFALVNGGDVYARDKQDHDMALCELVTDVSNFAKTYPELWDNYDIGIRPPTKKGVSHSADLDRRLVTYMVMTSIFDAGGTMWFSHLCSWAFIEALQIYNLRLAKGIAQKNMVPVLYRNLEVYPGLYLGQISHFQVKQIIPVATPLMVALAYCPRQVVYDIIDNVFLTRYDLYILPRNPRLIKMLDEIYKSFRPAECKKKHLPTRIVKKVFQKPLPLVKLTLIYVSERLGNRFNRESYVNGTRLPNHMQDMLLFKGLSVAAKKWSPPPTFSWHLGDSDTEDDDDNSDDDDDDDDDDDEDIDEDDV